MERKQFFILEKDFLNTREVGDLIEALGSGGVGAYMAILIYLRHQPAYTTCYRPSLLSQLARCNNGTVELFRDVLLNFGLFDFGEGEEPEFHSFYLDRVMEPMDRRCANSRRNGAKGGRPPKVARTVHNVIPEVMEEVTEPVAEEPLQLAVAEEEKPRKTYNTIQNNTIQQQKQQKRVKVKPPCLFLLPPPLLPPLPLLGRTYNLCLASGQTGG